MHGWRFSNMSGLRPLNTNSNLPRLDVIPQMFPDIAKCPGEATAPLVANRSHILSTCYGTCTWHSLIYFISKITPGGRGNYFHFTDEETENVSCLLTAPGLRTQPWVCSFSAVPVQKAGPANTQSLGTGCGDQSQSSMFLVWAPTGICCQPGAEFSSGSTLRPFAERRD